MSPKVWLITGCTSGFGAQFVHELLSRGEKVIASARNSSRLLPLQQKGAAIIELDVTSPQSVIDAAIQEAISIYGYIDVLINNAGNIVGGFCEEITYVASSPSLFT
jgi:NADP-dependent 3-hydroxy acid dehydrogenase YdfG